MSAGTWAARTGKHQGDMSWRPYSKQGVLPNIRRGAQEEGRSECAFQEPHAGGPSSFPMTGEQWVVRTDAGRERHAGGGGNMFAANLYVWGGTTPE